MVPFRCLRESWLCRHGLCCLPCYPSWFVFPFPLPRCWESIVFLVLFLTAVFSASFFCHSRIAGGVCLLFHTTTLGSPPLLGAVLRFAANLASGY